MVFILEFKLYAKRDARMYWFARWLLHFGHFEHDHCKRIKFNWKT